MSDLFQEEPEMATPAGAKAALLAQEQAATVVSQIWLHALLRTGGTSLFSRETCDITPIDPVTGHLYFFLMKSLRRLDALYLIDTQVFRHVYRLARGEDELRHLMTCPRYCPLSGTACGMCPALPF